MRIFDRYIGRQVLTATIIAILILTIVMVLGNIVKRLLTLPTEVLSQMPAGLLVRFVGYALVASLPFTVPWSLLTAVLLVFGRLSADNELLALRMAGNSFARLCLPIFILAAVLTAVCFWVNLRVGPMAQSEITRLPTLVATANPKALLAEDRIVDQIDDFVIYVGKKKTDGSLSDFQMIMLNEQRLPSGYIAARSVRVTENPAEMGLDLELTDATIILRDELKDSDPESGPRNVFRIKPPMQAGQVTQTVTLRRLYDKLDRIKPSMMGTMELSQKLEESLARAREEGGGKKKKGRTAGADLLERTTALRTEFHKRFSFSLACLVFVIVGIPLGVTAQRRETSIGFVFSLVIGIAYLSLLALGDSILKDQARMYPWLIVWLPNVLFLGLGGWLFLRLQRR